MSTLNLGKPITPPPAPAWTTFIPESDYHAAARSGAVMSSGMLKEFRVCPAQYHAVVTGARTRSETDALRFGRAAHKLILEGEATFRAAFGVGGPINEATGSSYGAGTKAFENWLRQRGLARNAMVTDDEYRRLRRMRDVVRGHPEIGRLLAEGWPERSARSVLEEVPCQIRLDWLRGDGVAVDLKTVEDITRFEFDARRFGYLHQFAFYREAALAAGCGDLEMLAAVVEKKPPHRAGVWRFSAAALEPYAEANRRSLRLYRRCRAENRWPTGYEQPRSFPSPNAVPAVWLN